MARRKKKHAYLKAIDSLGPDLLKKRAAETGTGKDWNTRCLTCGSVPTMPATQMCGPCTFGEAETAGGNW